MRITTKSKYGMMMLVEIAAQPSGKALALKAVAGKLNISEKYLEQIIISLIKVGYVKSIRGASGGYVIGQPPETLTAAMVIEALEGDGCMRACAGEIGRCARENTCSILDMWREINRATTEIVSGITIADLVKGSREKAALLGDSDSEANTCDDKPACNE